MRVSEVCMKERIIEAAMEEMQIHSLRFTMEDITRRLHIGRNSLYKIVPSKEALILNMIEYKIAEFKSKEAEILSEEKNVDDKLLKLMGLYTDTFGLIGNHIGKDLENMYPKVWDIWQKFHQDTIKNTIELIKNGMDSGEYNKLKLGVIEECLRVVFLAIVNPAFLSRNKIFYEEAVETLGRLILYGLKKR